MTREEAYCEYVKLRCGDWESYDEWLNTYLENEEPLSDIVLELLDCRGDIKEVERCLNLYCLEKPFDKENVYTRLRIELYRQYEKGIKTKDEVMSALFRFSRTVPFCYFQNCCDALSDYYELAENGVLNMQKFDSALEKWLKNGDEFSLNDMGDE